MTRIPALLVSIALAVLLVSGCSQAAPAPTAAPAAPTKAAAEPTKAAAPAPTTAPAATKPAAAPTSAPAAAKTSWPEKGKPITLLVTTAAGGAADVQARTLAPLLEKELGTTVQVVNKPGASSQVGLTELVKAPADGYTFAQTLLPTLYVTYLDASRQAPYTRKDIVQVANQVFDAQVIAVKSDSKYKTLKDLVDDAKANPSAIKIGSAGVQSNDHLGILAFEKAAGIKFSTVQFDGGAPGMTALLGGHLDAVGHTVGVLAPHVKNNAARVLGVMATKRSKFYPDVQTLTEAGYPVVLGSYRGFSVRAGTPKEVVTTLEAAIKKIAESPDMVKKMDELYLDQLVMGSDEYTKHWDQFEAQAKPLLDLAK